jgi:predicted ATPase
MITRFGVRNYKALRDVTIDLTPFHVLIGPNDSGKTSILEAIEALCRSTDHDLAAAFAGSWSGRDLVWNGDPDGVVAFSATLGNGANPLEYQISCRFPQHGRGVVVQSEFANVVVKSEATNVDETIDFQWSGHASTRVCMMHVHNKDAPEVLRSVAKPIFDDLAGAHFYRWDPRILALPVASDSKRRFRVEYNGFGLAQLLDDILGYDRDLFGAIEKEFCSVFPNIRSIQLIATPAYRSPTDQAVRIPELSRSEGKGIYLQLAKDGLTIPASQASDGTLLVLAYLAVVHSPKSPSVILLEEPENGIHPERLRDVLSILRGLTKEQRQTQIILTTHSPYALDLFEPHEVTLCTKQPDGSVFVNRLSESEKVREQAKVFTLGEIWTGEGDAALATGPGTQEGKS